jgi:hypothetical protein
MGIKQAISKWQLATAQFKARTSMLGLQRHPGRTEDADSDTPGLIANCQLPIANC